MTVPHIRNPNRSRRSNSRQKLLNNRSSYHAQSSPTFHRVGRRTKGGGGGGYVYGSSAYGNGGGGEGNVGIIVGAIAVCLLLCVVWCVVHDRKRQQNHSAIRNTRNLVHQRRSMRNLHATTAATRTAYPLQFHTQQQGTAVAYQSPSGPAAPAASSILTYMPSRHEKMLKHFNFQTVLPDKSNANAEILRQEQEDTTSNDDDDDSVIQKAAKDGRPKVSKGSGSSYMLSSRFQMSTWRRPNESDECSICLHGYDAGQTICIAKTTNCNHIFHKDCIEEWLKGHDNCPMCRVNLMYSAPY